MEDLVADLADVAAIAADIVAQKWVGLVERIVELGKNLYSTVICFKNAASENLLGFVNVLWTLYYSDQDQKQCILDHLKDAMVLVKKALRDALSGNTDAVSEDFQKIMDDLQYALNKC